MRRAMFVLAFAVTGCGVSLDVPNGASGASAPLAASSQLQGLSGSQASAAFASVSRSVEPAAERECLARTQGLNCDFLIGIDPDPNAPANAYQSQDRRGRPVITFTRAMLGDIVNQDELAFVMSHEAAHHIRGHLARQQQNAMSGSIIFAGLATLAGASPGDIASAQDLGAMVGARRYSKEFELEADQLGTLIAYRSGFRPSIGVQFFSRLPDPGDQFLGTHPANHDRVQVVQQTIQYYGLN